MKKRYAEVIVDIAREELDRPFRYRIPEPLADRVVPGSVVRIPFGRSGREIEGYVTGVSDSTDYPEDRLKEILDVQTGAETAEARLIALAAWMSRMYGATMIQALRTVLPVRRAVSEKTTERVCLADPDGAAALPGELRSRNRNAMARAVETLLRESPIPRGRLMKEAGVPLSVIRRLERDGVIFIESEASLRRAKIEAVERGRDVPSGEQEKALSVIRREWSEGAGRPVLLRGVTGSGKTVVYTELIADALAEGKQAIVLIPEISLTRQTVLRFVRRFGDSVSFLHSRLSEGERYDQMRAARTGEIRVMVGPRSALFTPFPNLGLIVIDEEHEETYHSEHVPRYHARDAAEKRAELEGAHLLLGSATPSVSSARRAELGIYASVSLLSRFGEGSLADAAVVDMRRELSAGNRSIFSDLLKETADRALSRGEQVMLFLNRRGYTGALTCRTCGCVVRCPHCDVSLTLHRNGRMICHYCGYETPALRVCPSCGSPHIGGLSVGTEQAEEAARAAWPGARILRMDADTTRGKEGHSAILKTFEEGGADILLGTQMIVKGHDFPNVTVVGVLLADLSLSESDYRSSERTFQLVTQAVGRAGRGRKKGTAVIQTYRPDHFSVVCAARQDYDAFYREEIAYRKILHYPPEGALMAVLGTSESEELLQTGMTYIRKYLKKLDPDDVLCAIGPAPMTVGKIRDIFREVIYIRNTDPDKLVRAKDLIMEYTACNRGFDGIRIQFDLTL